MSGKIIITIARQYGSGGREIGERVARELNIPCYDREIITDAANNGNLSEDVIINAEETAANSLLYTLAVGSNVLGTTGRFGYRMPLNDKLFILQSDAIREYSRAGSCVIIGRCADYVLRDEKSILRVFVYADIDTREARIRERHPEIKSTHIVDVINKTDKRRSSYYNFYTGNRWGKHEHYDLLVNSSTLGIDGAVKLIVDCVKNMI